MPNAKAIVDFNTFSNWKNVSTTSGLRENRHNLYFEPPNIQTNFITSFVRSRFKRITLKR